MNYPDTKFHKAVIHTPDPLGIIKVHPAGEEAVVKKQVEQAEQELARLKAQATAIQQRDKIATRIDNEFALAEATYVLLTHIRQLMVDQVHSVNGSELLSRFIKELQPLAQTYGVKIVKVGNGELATLVLASAK